MIDVDLSVQEIDGSDMDQTIMEFDQPVEMLSWSAPD